LRTRKALIPPAMLVLLVLAAFIWLSSGHYDYAGAVPYNVPSHLIYTTTSAPGGCLIEPTDPGEGRIGFILFPGGKIAPEAYLPVAEALAEKGMAVYIVKTPFNLAFFAPRSGDRVRESRPDIDRWLIGGHSLGGIVASSASSANPEDWAGLILFASYTTKKADLSETDLPVLSIYGSDDYLVPPAAAHTNARYLPVNTMYVNIPGANHAGFGYYGPQKGDGIATISPEDQRERVVTAISVFLERNGIL